MELGSLGAWSSGQELPNHQLSYPFHLPSIFSFPPLPPTSATRNLTLAWNLASLHIICLSVNLVGVPVSSCLVSFCASCFVVFIHPPCPPSISSALPPSFMIIPVTITVHRQASWFLPCFVSQLTACSLQFASASACGWPFHPHAMQFFTTWPPSKLASHCRAAAARELELWFGGLGWAAAAAGPAQVELPA